MSSELLAAVVVPARDEEMTIAECLTALAGQTVGTAAFQVILVADGCSDRTVAIASDSAARLGLRLTVIDGPEAGSGAARSLGLDAAVALHPLLLATTDADTLTAPDWLERQLDHLQGGAQVIAGLIELSSELPPAVAARRQRDAVVRLADVRALDPGAGHHHFAGASLGLAPEVYLAVGGMDPTVALEDEAFGAKLRRHRIPVLRAADVRVRTSTRDNGRAARGLSVDLAVSGWRERRRYDAHDFPLQRLQALKGTTSVTVIVPARECAGTIAGVLHETVGPLRAAGLVDELVVIDAASADGTAAIAQAAGAQVLQQDALTPELGPALGKGDAMWRALSATGGDLVCFLDADTDDPRVDHLSGLLGPLLADPELQLVKGAFDRPLRAGGQLLPGEGGRVTELMARPLLNLHFPLLAGFAQPLAGEFAGRRSLFERLAFPVGYGIEIAVLIDALRLCGLDALAESQLGTRQNQHQPLRALGEMAYAVLAAVERRIGREAAPLGGHYLRPWQDGAVVRVPVEERPPLSEAVSAVA